MSGAYAPQPGTVAYRVLAHMETLEHGAELSTAQISEALNVVTSTLTPCLVQALDARLIFKRQKHPANVRSPFFWSLVDHSEAPAPMPSNAVEKPGVAPTPVPEKINKAPWPFRPQELQKRDSQHVLKAEAARPDATDRETPAISSPVGGPMGAGQAAAAAPSGMRIALWSDGQLVIERGGKVDEFTADETRAIVHYLERMAEVAA